MTAAITKTGESLIAQKQAAKEVLEVVRFVLALVPGLDPQTPVDRTALKPPVEQLVHTQAYTQKGFVNPNQVVYSLMMGSDVGDFDWNWIGLETAEGVLLSVAYVPVQQKRKNTPPHQIGNNVTRNFMVVFDGAQTLTEITIDASTWQHDFTVRLHDIDERERLSNREVFGRACFFGNGLRLIKLAGEYQLKPGTAYLEGIRVHVASVLLLEPQKLPTKAWLDVALIRQENSVTVGLWVKWGEVLSDYVDSAGVQHYLFPLADLPNSETITDRRTVEPIDGPLVQHFAARNGDYSNLRARSTTKEDVGLGKLPNAKSDDPETNDSEILATTAALNKLQQQVSDSMVGMVASFAMDSAPNGWLSCNGAEVSRSSFAKLFARIGTTFGAGSKASTFQLPDMRGLFPRGWDEGSGDDPDREFGSYQHMLTQSHTHTASAAAVGDHTHGAWTDAQGEHAHSAWTDAQGNHHHSIPRAANSDVGNGGPHHTTANGHQGTASPTDWAGQHSHNVGIGAAGNHGHNVSIGGAGNHTHAITVAAVGGAETRPVNIALLFCIKY